VHDLVPLTALGGSEAQVETNGTVTLTELPDLALASVTARLGHDDACAEGLQALLGAEPPGPGKAVLASPLSAVWMGPDQWMIGAPFDSHEDLAARLKMKLKDAASVTEQSDGWVCFDVTGADVVAMFERLCAAPVRRMQAGDAQRSTIHQMGCFVICGAPGAHIRVLGPRSSAGSLHHALMQAAVSVA
jgi:sarcosine oxidase subunit gamma